MSPKFLLMAGYVLIVMGIGGLLVLDMPTWLGVWNLVLGVAVIAYATSKQGKEK
jgi:hypothetical protein